MQAQYNRTWMQKQTAKGLCICCNQPKLKHSKRCARHYFINAAAVGLKNRKLAPALARLFKRQNERCYLSGRLLVLGLNASVDHIRPRCRKGSSTIRNIRWCDKDVNQAKRGLSIKSFVALCKDVADQLSIPVKLIAN